MNHILTQSDKGGRKFHEKETPVPALGCLVQTLVQTEIFMIFKMFISVCQILVLIFMINCITYSFRLRPVKDETFPSSLIVFFFPLSSHFSLSQVRNGKRNKKRLRNVSSFDLVSFVKSMH